MSYMFFLQPVWEGYGGIPNPLSCSVFFENKNLTLVGGRDTSNVIQIVGFLFQVDTNCLHDNTGWLKGILLTAEYTPYNK